MTLPICRYTLTVEVQAHLHLPDFAGSMLRGAFGHALRGLACMTRQPECKDCPLLATCPYPMIFETPPLAGHSLQKFSQMPNPYVIEPPRVPQRDFTAGETFSFGMVLMGEAMTQLPLIVLAWERALQRGLGKQRQPCRLLAVHAESAPEPIYTPALARVAEHAAVEPVLQNTERATLDFLTPLRLQRQGQRVGCHELDARTLLMTLARRHQLLCDRHCGTAPQTDFQQIDRAARGIRLEADMRWRDWTRYSNRQKQEMKLGGLVGRIHLHGDLSPFQQLLALGQWLHVGKNTTFGLGHYRLAAHGHHTAQGSAAA